MFDRLRVRDEWKFAGILSQADRSLTLAWWTLLVLRGVLPALFAIAMGGLVQTVQQGGNLAQPLGLVGVVFVLLQVLSPIHQAVGANLGSRTAAWLYDHNRPCGKEANIAKYMSADACFEAADRAMQTHGGYGYIKDYDVERYWRECRLFRIAPISQEMVLNYVGEHVLGLPRSY